MIAENIVLISWVYGVIGVLMFGLLLNQLLDAERYPLWLVWLGSFLLAIIWPVCFLIGWGMQISDAIKKTKAKADGHIIPCTECGNFINTQHELFQRAGSDYTCNLCIMKRKAGEQ